MAKGRYREVPVFYPLPETPAYHGADGVQTVAEFGIHERNGREYVHDPCEPVEHEEHVWEIDETEFDVFAESLKFILDIPWPDEVGPCVPIPADVHGGEEDETE